MSVIYFSNSPLPLSRGFAHYSIEKVPYQGYCLPQIVDLIGSLKSENCLNNALQLASKKDIKSKHAHQRKEAAT